MSSTDDPALHAELQRLQGRLTELAEERARITERIAELQGHPSAGANGGLESTAAGASQSAPHIPRTATEKIALFRERFAGRTDVFPRLWSNSGNGREGYAPACGNEWVRGLCGKPRIRCGQCPHQAFIPLSDRVIRDHLQGRHVAGVYPLLVDETCRFLAVDFDKADWQEDVTAFAAACRRHEVPVAIERSRSGNGAHAWFFFDKPLPASLARRMGCALLTAAMDERSDLALSSYDRLFPNQDTMPDGGFGNLIALPLQHSARRHGNTVFVDDDFRPYADQWSFLARLPQIGRGRVEAIVGEAADEGGILGIRSADDAVWRQPWLRSPSGLPPAPTVHAPLPASVQAVLAQQIFVEKTGLPATLLARIKRLAAFQNPDFYRKQAMRLSTARTPRVIGCVEDFPAHLAVPRGCRADLEALLAEHGICLEIDDQRHEGRELDRAFHGSLSPVQEQAVTALLAHDSGTLVAPPGSGKTVMGACLIARRACNTLVLVHRSELLEQWRTQLSLFLDCKSSDVGQIGGGRRRVRGDLDVAMIQSLVRGGSVDDLVADYGHVLVDECHHIPAKSFEPILREARTRFVTGLTATPDRRDGQHPILRFQLGPPRFTIDARNEASRHRFRHRVIVRDTGFRLTGGPPAAGMQALYRQLAEDEARNNMILHDIMQSLADGRSPLVLTERREHLDQLAEHLRDRVQHLLVFHGGLPTRERRNLRARLGTIPETEQRLLLATGRFIGEGFDDARLDTLFLGLPVSWKGTLMQYAGRIHRRHPAKAEVRVHDYVDRDVPQLARMFEKRRKGYRAMGYSLEDASSEETSSLPRIPGIS